MTTYLPRSAWNARPSLGPTHLNSTGLLGTALHWPGMGNRRLFAQDDVARALRGWQDYHMDDRGWSDIAYQVAVDQAGRAWQLRGLTTRSGANGDADANLAYGAILLVVGTGEAPTGAMITTTRNVIADFRRLYPKATAIKPHSVVRTQFTGEGTDCPGDDVRALIAGNAFELPTGPVTKPIPPTTPEDILNMDVNEFKTALGDVLDAKLSKYVTGDNAHDSQVIAWQVTAQAYADKRFSEGADFDTVKNEVWTKIRPLWVS